MMLFMTSCVQTGLAPTPFFHALQSAEPFALTSMSPPDVILNQQFYLSSIFVNVLWVTLPYFTCSAFTLLILLQ